MCKRPCSNDEYLPTFNRPNVTLVDVSETKGVERMTEKGFVANGVEYEVDCMIFASGFEISTEISRRYAIEAVEGRDGVSIYDHWRDGYKTLHGIRPRLPEPVPHRLHPGRRVGQHHRDVRAAGKAHRLPHLRGAALRQQSRAEPGRSRRLGQHDQGNRDRQLRVRNVLHAGLLQRGG